MPLLTLYVFILNRVVHWGSARCMKNSWARSPFWVSWQLFNVSRRHTYSLSEEQASYWSILLSPKNIILWLTLSSPAAQHTKNVELLTFWYFYHTEHHEWNFVPLLMYLIWLQFFNANNILTVVLHVPGLKIG